MTYLSPPPNMSPVVVVKDFGGYVDQYAARTEEYRRTNREVRIHECHSACTMALSLPNVCVYPDSIFKFHQAYDPRNHVTNWQVSGALFNTYPIAVRERLGGGLTKQFTILRGNELIELGVRSCGEPQPRIIMAKATQAPISNGSATGGSTLSMLTGKLEGLLPNLGAKPESAFPDTRPTRRFVPDPQVAAVPLPPAKPDDLAVPPREPLDEMVTASIPMPPPRPKTFLVAYTPDLPPMPMVQIIGGAQPILPAHFVPFPKSRA